MSTRSPDGVSLSDWFIAAITTDGSVGQCLDAVAQVGRDDGILLCPEGGATLAAYQQALASGWIGRADRALLFNCASGLKYPLDDFSRWLDRTSEIDFASL